MEAPFLQPGDSLVRTSPGATVYVAFGRSAFRRVIEDLAKASADDPVHPGWPAGTPGGLGGKFRPKDGTDRENAEKAAKRVALRRAVRALLLDALTLPPEVAANVIPALGEAADIALVAQLAELFSEYRQLEIDMKAATDFVANGPYSLDDLRVTAQSESFSSYGQFLKSSSFDEWLFKRFGRAGDGYEYHHLVEQGGNNAAAFTAGELQNTDNIVRIPTLLHEAINGQFYSRTSPDPSLSYRQWLQLQPYSIQHSEGILIMRELGLIR